MAELDTDILQLFYLKENMEMLKSRIDFCDAVKIEKLIYENPKKLKKLQIIFKWDEIKIILKLYYFLLEPDFIKGFLFNHPGKELKIDYSQINNNIFPNNVCAIKYANKVEMISKTTLTQNKNSLYIQSEFLGIENHIPSCNVTHLNRPKRKVKAGTVFGDYLLASPEEKRIDILVDFFNWLFKKYKTKDKNKVSGTLLDCHFWNFLKTKNGYFYYDNEVALNEDLDKSYVLYYTLYRDNFIEWYNYFLKYYNIEDKSEYYKKDPHIKIASKKKLDKLKAQNNVIINRII